MLEPFYCASDAIFAFLWYWFGIRRRWCMALSMALSLVSLKNHHSILNIVFAAVAVIIVTILYFHERDHSPNIVNMGTLAARKSIVLNIVISVFLWVTISDIFLAHSQPDAFASYISDAGCLLWFMSYPSLIPTGPRKKWKLPRLSLDAPTPEVA